MHWPDWWNRPSASNYSRRSLSLCLTSRVRTAKNEKCAMCICVGSDDPEMRKRERKKSVEVNVMFFDQVEKEIFLPREHLELISNEDRRCFENGTRLDQRTASFFSLDKEEELHLIEKKTNRMQKKRRLDVFVMSIRLTSL